MKSEIPNRLFISFEGIDGTGKSSQVAILKQRFIFEGSLVETFRTPGSTKAGEYIRNLLQHDTAGETLFPMTEALLFLATHVQLLEQEILPCMDMGINVVCDRFVDSTIAYQVHGRKLPAVQSLARLSIRRMPDLTFLLDSDPAEALSKVGSKPDRMERESIEFHTRVRNGYLSMAEREPERFVVISAKLPMETVGHLVWDAVESRR